jgi:hypothetical protein
MKLGKFMGMMELQPVTYHGQYKSIYGLRVVFDALVPLGTIECRGHDGKVLSRILNVDAAECREAVDAQAFEEVLKEFGV